MAKMLTNQQVFDNGMRRLAEQGGPAFDSLRTKCEYRGHGGRACVIGASIPDARYQRWFEGHMASSLATLSDILPIGGSSFLNQFQVMHDDLSQQRLSQDQLWIVHAAFTGFAVEYNLDPATVMLIQEWEY